jgi:hypothetical protein
MRTVMLIMVGVGVALGVPAADAQPRGRSSQGIPPGHLPPPGECRVWYDGVPPGQQPPPISCRDAERRARRDGRARVIYGEDWRDGRGRWGDDDRDRWEDGRDGDDDRDRYEDDRERRRAPRDDGRAVPRRVPRGVTDRDRSALDELWRVAYDNGYDDGYRLGQEDERWGRDRDPNRHDAFRSQRPDDRRIDSSAAYTRVYRAGFTSGYDDAYDDGSRGR